MALVYRCCFWFSLRLGSILTGIFCILQSALIVIASIVGLQKIAEIKQTIGNLLSEFDFDYTTSFIEYIHSDLRSIITIVLASHAVYILICVGFIYGSYKMINSLIYAFLAVELVRLLICHVILISWLMVIKKNGSDIGVLIAASVIGGFNLLGLWYLWVCTLNFPMVMNELKAEEMEARVIQLERLLELQKARSHYQRDIDLVPAFPDLPIELDRSKYNTNSLNNFHAVKSGLQYF